ncbi:MAG: methyl-accepting chemotaxis protein [Thermoanaerobaculia bacterium]|nr:methyl-accepting chemotaxis protein [Thermoanaerobaculia bacterium]
MSFFRNLGLAGKLLLLVGVFVAVFATFAFVSMRTLETVRVNGPVYRDIIQGKDIIADVLPPPQYIIETHLVTLQLVEEADPAAQAALIERGNALRLEFESRHEYWRRTLSPGVLADAMNVTAYRPALEYLDTRDKELLPALKAKDEARVRAILATLKQKYEAHRRAVDEVVRMATAQNAQLEKAAEDSVRSRSRDLLWLGALVVAVVLLIAWVTGRMADELSRRIGKAAEVAAQVASGDLTASVPETSGTDESARLLSAIRRMTADLSSLVTRVKQASIELMSTATEFTATSRQQESAISGFGSSTNEIAAAVKEISATSAELLATMEGVNAVAAQTAQLAEGGRSGLRGMDETMHQLEQATSAISARLSAIREKTSDISGVVTTITKVADQTNLLSVNAAIEAEKAGEQGLGFLVLAREIRRLADQTAVATLDIEQMVRHMQSAVSAGVMEMDRFAADVKRGVSSSQQVASQLGQIITQVQTLSERFDSVNHGMRSQSQGARQISEAMAQLMDGARQSATSLKEFNAATAHLRDAVTSLKEEISHFKVPG